MVTELEPSYLPISHISRSPRDCDSIRIGPKLNTLDLAMRNLDLAAVSAVVDGAVLESRIVYKRLNNSQLSARFD